MKPIDFTQLNLTDSLYHSQESGFCRMILSASGGILNGISTGNGLCALISQGEKYTFSAAEARQVLLELSFSPEFLTPALTSALREKPTLFLTNPAPELLEYAQAFCRMLPLQQGVSLGAVETGLSALLFWFSHFLALSRGAEASHARRLVDQAKDIIRSEYMSDLSLQSVASRLFVSPCYLSTVFHQTAGTTLRAYLRDVRLEHTCRLLTQTNSMITDIAMQTGFNSTAYLISSFRKVYGITPNAYRARQQLRNL